MPRTHRPRRDGGESLTSGRHGGEQSLPAIEAALDDPNPELRASAVAALRFVFTPTADSLLAQFLLNDPAEAVRSQALNALRYRQALAPVLVTAIIQALRAEKLETLRLGLVQLAGMNVAKVPEFRDALAWTRLNDPSENVRDAARDALASESSPISAVGSFE